MARRKQVYDSARPSLFDFFAQKKEKDDKERSDPVETTVRYVVNDPSAEKAGSVTTNAPLSFPTNDISSMRHLGRNKKGASVYSMADGSRMYSFDTELMQCFDGEKRTPEQLYEMGSDDYLTIEEVSRFAIDLSEEIQNARQTKLSSGNRKKSPKTTHDRRGKKRGVYEFGLLDIGSLGTGQSRRPEETGGQGGTSLRPESIRTTTEGDSGTEQRSSLADEAERDERLGDLAELGNRNEAHNYRITAEDDLGSGGAKTKYADNIAAIRLLKRLEETGAKSATTDEQKILVRYVGWGGLPQVFDPKNEKWANEFRELQGLLSPDEYAKARRSTQDAHYTSETVIRGIYDGLERIGLNSGEKLRILEPSAGIGNFIGLCPAGLDAEFMAVEQDITTSAISRYLYPESQHLNTGFQNSNIRAGGIDAVVGNPPFGSQSLFDPDFPELRRFSIHNYFLAKSIELLREGGVAAFVVSRFFMDSVDPTVREHIAQKADLLGAIRLPETAFRRNALTDVTTDIVFFQKNTGEKKFTQDWVQTGKMLVEDLKHGGRRYADVNSYFVKNPGQLIGELAFSGGMYADALNCRFDMVNNDLSQEIAARLDVLPKNVFVPREESPLHTTVRVRDAAFLKSEYFQSLKMNALCVEPRTGKIVFKTAGMFGEHDYDIQPVKSETARLRLTAMIQIRDTLRALLDTEKADAEESLMVQLRIKLNSQYDSFVKKYGHLNSQTNRSLMRDDPEHSLLESLEVDYDKGLSPETAKKQGREPRPASAKKAAIFQKRVLQPAQLAEHAESAKDALIICLRESGKVDFSRMGQLLSRSGGSVQEELQEQSLIFLNPSNEEWEIRDKYLTGNVRGKLQQAKEAARMDARYAANVEALAAALPPDIEAVDIGIRFGSTWVPPDIVSDFVEHLHCGKGIQTINYMPTLGKWEASVSIFDQSLRSSVWGIPEYPADKLIESLLTNRSIKVEKESGQYDDRDRPIMIVDQELTAAAMQKADEIKQAFLDWVWNDDERRERLTTLYNERFNTHVPPHYDGSHIELVGASSEVRLRPHQKDVVWRAIQEGTALFDHVVGAGKTMACIATIMESKRMGFTKKPMVVVPNHLLSQWKDEFYKLYPGANILVADKDDFTKANRERLFSRIATGDWDAVIVAHSSFKKIDMPHDVQTDILQEQIDMVVTAIASAKESEGSRATVKQLEKQRERMEAQYAELLSKAGKKDQAVDFSDLGVDSLFVDESHEFKNLAFQTSMNVSGMGNIAGSGKALDLFVKCRYLQRKNQGRGVYFLTGTPISNTIAEVYTLQRYMQYEELKNKEIEHFDAWASTFGQITNGFELDATGVNYALKSRFAKFQNVPELLSMYRTFADVVTKSDLDEQAREAGLRPLTPPVTGGKPFNHVVERSDAQGIYMEQIIARMEHLPADPREDNPLKITNDARKAGLDFRLIDPEAKDHPGSKVNAAVDRIFDMWQSTSSEKGTQLVFCDLSTPKGRTTSSPRPDSASAQAAKDIADPKDIENEGQAENVSMDELIAVSSGKFSVYDDIKQKLIEKGIPAEEISFIHDANTDIRKAKLFSDMNAGLVRVLIGSTAKMGAGMNVQRRLVAAHHLDAPWRPSDLEQRNGRIIRQGNIFYEQDPDNFTVGIFNYATKQTYDARMWQCIEYKSAAIEQFRKGDLLQRIIDDVQSEAANAAEMKAAASGNPLILMQVQLASDLRKLEALYSQHQRGQHRLRDRLRWLEGTEERLAKAEAAYRENVSCRDKNTRIVTEKGKEKIHVELRVDGNVLTAKDNEKMRDWLIGGVKEVTRNASAKVLFGTYRGFDIHVERVSKIMGHGDGFRLTLQGTQGQEFRPNNLIYGFDEKFSLAGLFQRMDNFLAKGFDEAIETVRAKAKQEKAELETVRSAMGKEFSQKEELALLRENHSAVIRELQRMQDQPGYVSTWVPKTSKTQQEPQVTADLLEERQESPVAEPPAQKKISHTLKYGEGEGRTEYRVSNQHNGHMLPGYVVQRTWFSKAVGSLGQGFYEDGKWYSTSTAPNGVKLKQFTMPEEAQDFVRRDAAERKLQENSPRPAESPESMVAPPPLEKTKLTFGEGDGKIEYVAYDHKTHHTLERAHFRNTTRWPVYWVYDDDRWHTPQNTSPNAYMKKFASAEEALVFARRDAAAQGLQITESETPEHNYRTILEKAGFQATGKDLYGKNEYSSTVKTSDGGMYSLRLFQQGGRIGLRSQYEKYNIIDTNRTVDATFDTLDEALDFVGGYQVSKECRSHVHQETRRMRMR